MFRRTSALAATLLLTFVTGSPALAEQLSRVVHYSDLDLTNRTGVRALRNRVYHAANWVCALPLYDGSVSPRVDGDCKRAAIADAEPKIQRAVIDASHQAEIQLAAR